ncbi:MAG TPA: hypothetical protein VE645_04745 [Pseudonocardiaceae bacterium]|nr:hypothetical protein [Pseudonocardiaceae bacterium]
MPAVVAGIVGMREPDRESAQPGARDPPARAHELVVCGEQPRGVRRGAKRLIDESGHAQDWPGPGRRVVWVTAGGRPQQRSPGVGDVTRERAG